MTVLDFVRLLRHNLLVLIGATLLGLGAAAVYAYLQPVVYQSSAQGVVVAGDNTSIGGAMSGSALAQQRAGVYASLIGTQAVRQRVAETPEVQANPAAMNGGLSASVIAGTPLLNVVATGTSGENARTLADAGLKALSNEVLALESLTPSNEGGQVDPNAIAVRIAPYTQANASAQPVSPNWTRLLLIGAAAGLAMGMGIAILRRQLDVRVRTITDVEEATGHGVLGVVPDSKALSDQRDGGRISLGKLGATGEALRQLRTNLRYVNIDNPPRAIVVTSSNPAEESRPSHPPSRSWWPAPGQPVVLIDADLRKPVQHKIFDADNAVGLAGARGRREPGGRALATSEPNLYLVTAGTVPANPSEMVGSRRMRMLINNLAKHYYVIIDAPPLLAVTDAGLLAASTDGAVLVSRVGKTQREQLKFSAKLLDQVGATLLGTVLHRANPRSMGNVVYGAGYGGKYQTYYGKDYLAGRSEDPTPVRAARASEPKES